jgi:hypothetical protein
MENPNDPKNIRGMTDILSNDDEVFDVDKYEQEITSGILSVKKESRAVDFAKEYDHELKQLNKKFNTVPSKSGDVQANLDNLDNFFNYPKKSSDDNNDNDSEIAVTADSDNDSDTASVQSGRTSRKNDDLDEDSNIRNQDYSWTPSRPRDEQLFRMTAEERKQKHVNKVLGSIDRDGDDTFIQQEEEEDEMAKIIELVDLLRADLEAQGIDLKRIPEVTPDTSKKDARNILKILQIKIDRLRYCDFFEEVLLAAAYGLEGFFDGKKEYFGSKIDLTGWPETVKTKLRRMRYDTSSFVSSIMSNYSIGHGWRIVLELLPSIFLYSRDRRLHTNDNLMSDDNYKDAIRNLQT